MLKDGKVFGKINVLDFAVVVFIVLAIAGLALVKLGKHVTSDQVIIKNAPVEFDVYIKGARLSSNENLFPVGKESFITIRNVPYTALKVVKSTQTHYQTVIPNPHDLSQAIAVDDPTEQNTYNYFVTLTDNATVTEDGPVIGGNKIKIGLPVTLEGQKYRLSGTVSDVRILAGK